MSWKYTDGGMWELGNTWEIIIARCSVGVGKHCGDYAIFFIR